MNNDTSRVILLLIALLSTTIAWGMKIPSREVYIFKTNKKPRHEQYDNKKVVQIHYQSQKKDKEPYQCSECGFGTKKEYNFMHHQQLHDVQKKGADLFVCDRCHYLAEDKNRFQNHLATHTTEKKYPCTFEGCDNMFKTLRTLKQHKMACHIHYI